MKALLYCTKSKKKLFYDVVWKKWMYGFDKPHDKFPSVNGMIVASCEVKVEKIELNRHSYGEEYEYLFDTPTLSNDELLCESGLSEEELENYLDEKGYALHISNLELFEKPRLLNYFFKGKLGSENSLVEVTKAPQNMMRVYISFDLPEIVETKYVLISIRPEWLCKILNGEKTIEVRKQVLKEMIGK